MTTFGEIEIFGFHIGWDGQPHFIRYYKNLIFFQIIENMIWDRKYKLEYEQKNLRDLNVSTEKW